MLLMDKSVMDKNELQRANRSDEYTLLCERCGYIVEGLSTDGPCPECGRLIAKSLPERRGGTPWQRRGGLVSLLATGFLVAVHPKRTLDRMMVQPPKMGLLLAASAFPMGLLSGAGVMLLLEMERPLPGGGTTSWSAGSYTGAWVLAVMIGVVITPFIAMLLWTLTWVEARGLVLFGAQHQFRMHPRLAHTIVRHGAFGWLLSGLGAAMALPLAFASGHDWQLVYGPPGDEFTWLASAGLAVAVIGFLAFEVFAWLGLRRCRFVNSRRPTATGTSS